MNRRALAALPAIVLALSLGACSGTGGDDTPQSLTPGTTPVAAGSNYCDIVNAGTAFDSDVGSMADDLNTLIAAGATLDEIHAQGATLLSASIGTAAYFDQIAAAVSDPTVAAAYSGMGDLIVALYQAEGQAAVDATSGADYATRDATITGSTEVTGLVAQRPAWSTLIGDYFQATCT